MILHNRVLVVKPHFKTPYELFRGRTTALSFMRPFGCHVIIFNTLNHLGKFDGKSDEGFFVVYSTNSKAFRVYNTRTRKVEENLHINFLENKPIIEGDRPKWLFDIDSLTKLMNYVPVIAGPRQDYILMPLWNDGSLFNSSSKDSDGDNKDNDGPCKESEIDNQERPNAENSTKDVNIARPSINTASSNINTASPTVNIVRQSDDFFGVDNDMRSLDEVEVDISNISTTYLVPTTLNTRIHKDHSLDNVIGDMQSGVQTRRMIVTTEPKRIINALKDPAWVEAMQEELLQFHLHKVWTLVDFPRGKKAIGTIWVFRNKKDEKGIVIRNKYRIEEEVYVCQSPGFEDPDYPDKVYKRQDQTLFIKRQKEDIMLVQMYVDDILFGSTKKELCTEFEKLMHDKFQMSLMGELAFFLGLQVKKNSDGIFISQYKYVDEILRKFKYADVKPTSTLMDKEKALLKDSDGDDVDVHLYRSMIGSMMYPTSSRPDIMFAVCTCARFQVNPKVSHLHAIKRIFRYLKEQPKLGLWYPKDSSFDLVAYTDSDYAGASLDRKSTLGGCQF
nr:hypothetical protein [Tanacetum cinerariifolium]